MSNIVQLIDNKDYRQKLNDLQIERTNYRQAYIDSLSLVQYTNHKRLQHSRMLSNWTQDYDVKKITKDSRKIALCNKWLEAVNRANIVHNRIEVSNQFSGLRAVS